MSRPPFSTTTVREYSKVERLRDTGSEGTYQLETDTGTRRRRSRHFAPPTVYQRFARRSGLWTLREYWTHYTNLLVNGIFLGNQRYFEHGDLPRTPLELHPGDSVTRTLLSRRKKDRPGLPPTRLCTVCRSRPVRLCTTPDPENGPGPNSLC